jgi:hypothetical protein
MVHMARVVDSRVAYKVLMERSERRRPFERQRCRREDNRKMHPKFLEGVVWTYLIRTVRTHGRLITGHVALGLVK